jgi:hypothetical protein
MMDTHQRLNTARKLIRSQLCQQHGVNKVWISFMRELGGGILVIYTAGNPNDLATQECVAFFTTGTVDNHPAVRLEWVNPCEAQ